MSAISSSIFGDSDCTLAVSTFNRLLGCIYLPAFVGGGFPCGDDRGICGVCSTVGCCRPWRSLLFLMLQSLVLLANILAGFYQEYL